MLRNLGILSCLFALAVAQNSCYNYDIDVLGLDSNNGLNNRQPSASDCQLSCQRASNCNFWVWVSEDFYDAYYIHACWHKEYIDEVLNREGAVSGPKFCPTDTGSCCDTITLDASFSSGVCFDQPDSVGDFTKDTVNADGTYTYRQDDGSQYLYYLPEKQVWMVGDNPGVDYGYILNRSPGQCPEDLQTPWQYWKWTDEWAVDDDLVAVCNNDPDGGDGGDGSGSGGSGGGGWGQNTTDPNIEYEECATGAACYGCSTTSITESTLYCCSDRCNSGYIETWSQNGVPGCRCWHDN